MEKKWLTASKYAFSTSLLVALTVGCSSNDGSTKSGSSSPPPEGNKVVATATPTAKKEPITLRVFNFAGSSKEQFDHRIIAHIQKKYPHITVVQVDNVKGSTLEELAAANQMPDLFFGKTSDQDLMMDLTPLIKKHNFDINKIKPVLRDAFNYFTDTTEKTLFLPLVTNMHVMEYNIDIFDRFGVPYPKDGMTWDETYDLAKRVTRTDNGVKIMGFNFRGSLNLRESQLAPNFYDEKTGKTAINTDEWKRLFANFTRFFTISGNEVTQKGNELNNDALFVKDQRVAMYASHPIWSQLGTDFKWDQVALPTFADKPRISTAPNANGIGITKATKYPDDAFLAIVELLTDESQLVNSKLGWESVLTNDTKQQAAYGSDAPNLKGKNIGAFFYNKYAPYPKANNFNSALKDIPYTYFRQITWGDKDLNTALREAEEAMNKAIDQVKLAKGLK